MRKGVKKSEVFKKKLSEYNKKIKRIPPSHKGKTYKEIYGDRAEEESEKRRQAHLKKWDIKGRKIGRPKHQRSEYVQWRTKIFQRDNWTCQNCKKRGYVEAHHIKSWSKFPELRFNLENGVALCKVCHKLTENYGNKKINHEHC